MNFTREPILETIISAKEGFKLKLKSTKSENSPEYLVDAVEVVSFGQTFFYRSAEPANTFFVPAQDFEIVQERQARLMLKTPTEKSIKIAGGDTGKGNSTENTENKKKSKSKNKNPQKKVEEVSLEDAPIKEQEPSTPQEKKQFKEKHQKRHHEKSANKSFPKNENPATQTEAGSTPQSSIFSHLLRPPEALISDNIHKYQKMMMKVEQEPKESMIEETKTHRAEFKADNPIDDPNLTSEAPKPFEKLSEEPQEESRPLSLKEKMKKVLLPSIKEVTPSSD